MKRLGLGIFLAVSCFMIASMTFAQDPEQAKRGMMGMGREGGMPPPPMMGNLVATNDGGVVVMMGNRLYKYDKNLNLVKETEIKVDMKRMQGMMRNPDQSTENK